MKQGRRLRGMRSRLFMQCAGLWAVTRGAGKRFLIYTQIRNHYNGGSRSGRKGI